MKKEWEVVVVCDRRMDTEMDERKRCATEKERVRLGECVCARPSADCGEVVVVTVLKRRDQRAVQMRCFSGGMAARFRIEASQPSSRKRRRSCIGFARCEARRGEAKRRKKSVK